uniref:Distal membrane-arm assembly complex protein 1-like domain-containing protein n=1 Tax=Paramormyrops kingsleyae TaxID=1676925 RepID=A0A3B3QJW0_9TELE
MKYIHTQTPPSDEVRAPASPPKDQLFGNCWGCRLLSGGGLLLAGGYVFQAARRVTRQGGPASMGTVAQIVFAACLASWGVVLIVDPVGKAGRKA